LLENSYEILRIACVCACACVCVCMCVRACVCVCVCVCVCGVSDRVRSVMGCVRWGGKEGGGVSDGIRGNVCGGSDQMCMCMSVRSE